MHAKNNSIAWLPSDQTVAFTSLSVSKKLPVGKVLNLFTA